MREPALLGQPRGLAERLVGADADDRVHVVVPLEDELVAEPDDLGRGARDGLILLRTE